MTPLDKYHRLAGMESPISALLPFSFYNFFFWLRHSLLDVYKRQEVARLLGIPVVLVVDAKSAAYSMAPLLSGFINFRPDIRIAGVIFLSLIHI